ncbi:capping protein, Arp2/3 and myosin-I linker protein 2-like isoform X2 [Protopterus annectens]|uniref:capping protein, Arp2/3 and myosin-I linker protein 2-like isoform X2 n=1 Tax=Protopterus annectens TaxID=7888 RepID=UPI001CFAF2EF|nr:capping protein, Arp2/3 and myosin-I linker protein 2-like isoform X2 [Protopterus annectens]XP_043937381.1 capping protein, Arp2/3 and myosin-I linker protein 2-like isoform X2 [Protopterus annectens]
MSLEDLEQVVNHVTASLKKIFPDYSPGKILKKSSPDLQEKIKKLTANLEEVQKTNQGPCGGFSETYAALCDYNGFPCRDEIQWDVDNIYHSQDCREFNLLDFSHLESRDVALSIAALSFNQWFTKLYCKDFKLNLEVSEQILFLINKSLKLEEVALENSGLKFDFAQRMAQALEDHHRSVLHTISLANNQIEDKGIMAFGYQFERMPKGMKHLNFSRTSITSKGANCLCQSFTANEYFKNSLQYLDLSGNPGILATDEECLYNFLMNPNSLSHLDLSGTDCALDSLFGALLHGCTSNLTYLNVSKNAYSHKKTKDIPAAIKEFFSVSESLKYIGLSGTKIPPEALRALLQGLASNTRLTDVHLDMSSCELRSAGAQVIQDHIFDANAINSLDLSDNGFDTDMVTLIISIGRSKSIRHISLGKNFNFKSKTLADALHRIVQLIQDEDCPIQSLSVADSRLKSGTNVLINALGSNTSLTKLDISGNSMGDTGAKMLAKALQINTKLSTVIWDRNNTTANGLFDIANALQRNYTLKSMPLPMNDIVQAYRNNPEKTEEAVQKIQSYLLRNNQVRRTSPEQAFRLQQGIITSASEQMVDRLCTKVQEHVTSLSNAPGKEVQEDVLFAEDTVKYAKTSVGFLPVLYKMGSSSFSDSPLHGKLETMSEEISHAVNEEIRNFLQAMMYTTRTLCPKVMQKSDMWEQYINRLSNKMLLEKGFVQNVLVEQAGIDVFNKLSEIKLSITAAISEKIIDEVLEDLTVAQQKLVERIAAHIEDPPSITAKEADDDSFWGKSNFAYELSEDGFPTDEYTQVLRRKTKHSRSIRPTPAVTSLSELDIIEGQTEDNESEANWGLLSVNCVPGKSHPVSSEDAGAKSNLPPSKEPADTQPLMELPTEGQKLEHCTRARPRPNRRNKQPPSKHTPVVCDTEESETNTRVDDGLEEFFNKRLIEEPVQIHSGRDEESVTSVSSGSKNIKKKFGDYFLFKKTKYSKTQKPEKELEGNTAPNKRLKQSFAELLRAPSRSGDSSKLKPEEKDTLEIESSQEESKTPDSEKRNVSKRALREGKTQSLILMSGGSQDDLSTHDKKRLSDRCEVDIPNTFEQRVHVMLHKIGVKGQSSDSKKKQNKEGEIKKAGSDGDIVDTPEPLPPAPLPRTFSASNTGSHTERAEGKEVKGDGQKMQWLALGKQLNSELKLKHSEPKSSPQKSFTDGQLHPKKDTDGDPRDSNSPSRLSKSSPIPPLKKVSSHGELKEMNETTMVQVMKPEENQPKPKPRVMNFRYRKAISVHEEQLSMQTYSSQQEVIKVPPIRLQRSPVMKKKKPELIKDVVVTEELVIETDEFFSCLL